MPAGRGQPVAGFQPGPSRRRGDTPVAQARHTLVEEGRVDALHPRGVFVAQILVQLQNGAHLPHLYGGNPRGGKPPLGQQLPHMRRVGRVRLGPPLTPPRCRRVRRLRQPRLDPGPLKLLNHEPPPRARLHREGHIGAAGEPFGQPPAQHRPARRGDPPPLQPTRVRVDIVESDLSTMHVQASYDGHDGTSSRS